MLLHICSIEWIVAKYWGKIQFSWVVLSFILIFPNEMLLPKIISITIEKWQTFKSTFWLVYVHVYYIHDCSFLFHLLRLSHFHRAYVAFVYGGKTSIFSARYTLMVYEQSTYNQWQPKIDFKRTSKLDIWFLKSVR